MKVNFTRVFFFSSSNFLFWTLKNGLGCCNNNGGRKLEENGMHFLVGRLVNVGRIEWSTCC